MPQPKLRFAAASCDKNQKQKHPVTGNKAGLVYAFIGRFVTAKLMSEQMQSRCLILRNHRSKLVIATITITIIIITREWLVARNENSQSRLLDRCTSAARKLSRKILGNGASALQMSSTAVP